jgi:hypothetical protein
MDLGVLANVEGVEVQAAALHLAEQRRHQRCCEARAVLCKEGAPQ